MKKMLKKILLKLGVLNFVRKFHSLQSKISQENNKRKQDAVRAVQSAYTPAILIETGTYLGDMLYAVKNQFKHLYSIELSKELYENAVRRFSGDAHITIYNGDSGILLPELLSTIHEPILFWLDAHYSVGITARGNADTPITKELESIFAHSVHTHCILIDDARLFVDMDGYPTLDEVRTLVAAQKAYTFDVKDDIIRILPSNA